MIWLARSCLHIASTRCLASCSLVTSRLTSMYLPTRTSETSLNPSVTRPCLTVMPCGSLTTGFGITITLATRVTDGNLGERFGVQVAQLLGAAEHRSARIDRCVSEERRSQRRRWVAWAPKIRRLCSSMLPDTDYFLDCTKPRFDSLAVCG